MRVENTEARDYYLREAAENSWSSRLLERNINTFYYQRLLSSQNKSLLPVKASEQMQLGDFIKDPYILEFLDIDEPLTASERQIETAIIDQGNRIKISIHIFVELSEMIGGGNSHPPP